MTKRFELNHDLTCPELAGYKLPELPRRQEDEMKVESEKYGFRVPYNGSSEFYDKDAIKHFESGYTKAREKFEFTMEDMEMAIKIARTPKKITFDGDELTGKIIHKHLSPSEVISEVIALTTRHPIAIEVEMEYYYMSSVKLYGKNAGWVKCDKIQFDGIKESIPTCPLKEIPATNPDGTVKGRWVYE